MSNDDHDDGLVHAHGWATEPPPAAPGPMRQQPGRTVPAEPAERDRFDDGLVHTHGWACAERGREAHG